MNKNPLSIAINTALYTVLATSIIAPQVFAAENEIVKPATQTASIEEKNKVKVDEKITVTGSRLRRDSFTVVTPLVTLDRETISDTGLGEMSEILVDNMPSLSYGTSNTTSQSSVSNTGITTVQLRDLGTNRTLTLIDGRRVVSNSKSGNYVSMSTIPSGMVKKVEIITGGASATYGADAVSGVVNIITQTGQEGFSFKARGGESTSGGEKEFTLDLDYGTSFADDRGYLFFSSNYDRQYGLKYGDRDRAAVQTAYQYDDEKMCNAMKVANGDYVCMRDTNQSEWRSLSDGTFGGVFLESSRFDKVFWYEGQTLNSVPYEDWSEEEHGINTREFVQLKVPSERISAALKLDFDITDEIMFYSQLQWSGNYTVNDKSPEDDYEGAYVTYIDRETGEPGRVRPGYIPIDNPYVPDEIREAAGEYRDRIYWDRRFAEVGNISTDNERTTIRSWAGLQGVMFDGEWDWDVSVGYGKFHQKQYRNNELNIFRVQNALDAGYAEDGTIQCNDAAARAAGCAPLNLFGEGSISTQAADYIRSNPTLDTYNEQITVMGYIAGDLFEMPAGSVATVFGAEYRQDSQEAITDEELSYGGITWNLVPSFKGEINVAEIFAEASFPLLRDVVGAKHLSLETSVRFAEYDIKNVDLVSSYKLGFLWSITEGLNIRGNWAIAQRAPSINELYEPAAGDFDSYTDICKDTTATSDEKGHDNCRLDPRIATIIAEEGVFEGDDNNYSPNAGNPDLFEETGETVTLGFTYKPSFFEGFSIAVDYYDIAITDAIDEYSNQRIMEECYASSVTLGQPNEFCDAVTRNSDGEIIEIMQRSYNIDELSNRGVDIAVAYAYDLNDFGRFAFKMDWTHLLESSNTSTGIDGVALKEDWVGYGFTFEDKASASIAWYLDSLRIRWSTSYKSAMIRSKSQQESWQEDIAANTENCATEDPDAAGCIAAPEALKFQNYASYFKHNLSASYTIEMDKDAEVRLFGGVNNVFDDKGQFFLGGRGNYGSAYDAGTGRFVYLGAEINF